MEQDIIKNLNGFGVPASALTGAERITMLKNQINPLGKDKSSYKWSDVTYDKSVKDLIAPQKLDFSNHKFFKVQCRYGSVSYGAVSHIQILAPELSDKMLADFLNMDDAISVNLHFQTVDQQEAQKFIKRKITDIDSIKIDEQKKASASGYDMDIIPSDLNTFGNDAKAFLKQLQSGNERMFIVTATVMNVAKTQQKLDDMTFAASGITQKYNCNLKRLDFRQELGSISSLTLGLNQIKTDRRLTTSATGIFMPFTVQELYTKGETLYYGLNTISKNIIMVDRKELPNPKGLYNQGRFCARKNNIGARNILPLPMPY